MRNMPTSRLTVEKLAADCLDVRSRCLRNWPIGTGKKKSAITVAQINRERPRWGIEYAGSIKIAHMNFLHRQSANGKSLDDAYSERWFRKEQRQCIEANAEYSNSKPS